MTSNVSVMYKAKVAGMAPKYFPLSRKLWLLPGTRMTPIDTMVHWARILSSVKFHRRLLNNES